MANLMGKIASITLATSVFISCGKPSEEPAPRQLGVAGNVGLSDGSKFSFDAASDKPLVVMFAQELCGSCKQEANDIRTSLSTGKAPTNVNILTVLLATDQLGANEWQKRMSLPWRVGYDEDLSFFYKHFPQGTQTPATFVALPEKGIVYRHVGITSREQLEEQTGKWQ